MALLDQDLIEKRRDEKLIFYQVLLSNEPLIGQTEFYGKNNGFIFRKGGDL